MRTADHESVHRLPSSVLRPLSSLLLVLLAAGCASTPEAPVRWGQREVEAFGKLARSPQIFAITVTADRNGVRFKGGNRLYEGHAAELRMKGSGDAPAPIVELQPGGPGAFNALIDTSSRHSWLAQKGVKNANIIPLGPPLREALATHVVDPVPGLMCLAPTINFDTLSMQDVVFYVHAATGPLGVPARGEAKPAPDAVLGTETLRSFSFVRLDFRNRSVAVASTREFKPDEDALIAKIPMKEVAGAIACEGVIDGEPATVILDTGGNYGFAMKDPPVRPIRQISLGDLVFRDVQADSTEKLGIGPPAVAHLGRARLSRFVVTLDFKNKRVVFERPR